jgi:hypothetical protein
MQQSGHITAQKQQPMHFSFGLNFTGISPPLFSSVSTSISPFGHTLTQSRQPLHFCLFMVILAMLG